MPGDTVGRRDGDFSLAGEEKDLTIRVEAAKLDEVLTLSGEIGLTKNRLNHIRVEFVLLGDSTELDKTMMEDLNDPIVHLIRNAVDHGVETPKNRKLAGKSEQGTVQLET